MKKIIIGSLLASSFLIGANLENFDPKAQKDHLVIKMEINVLIKFFM